MLDAQILSHLDAVQQKQLLAGFEQLSTEQKVNFLQQIKLYDLSLLQRQKEVLYSGKTSERSIEPVQGSSVSGSQEDKARGEALIREGKVGCLILAGGQGSRLGFSGPKGAVGVSAIKGKSLFQLFSERTLAASVWAERPLHLAIMTSPLNHEQTQAFFEAHQHFDLPATHLDFFEQSVLPLCDDRGNWLLEKPGQLAVGPDGNGRALHHFYHSGLFEKWRADGVEYINVILVDNPLADPFDAELIGFHDRRQADVIVKAVQRVSAQEKMGVVVRSNNKLAVIEYTEISDADLQAVNPDGSSRFPIANTSLFSFHMDFIRKIATDPTCVLPLHLARKKADVLLGTAQGHCTETVQVWKYETFIFDLLAFATSADLLLYPRDQVYSPLKNASGEKSLSTVQKALIAHDRRTFFALSGKLPPETPFELHPSFYYPTAKLAAAWKGKELPATPYIEPFAR